MTSGENEVAREAAIAEIVRAIQGAAEALEARGRPGIAPHSGSTHTPRTVNGWKVEFGRPDLAVSPPDLRLPKPQCRCYNQGSWLTGVFERGFVGDVVITDARRIARRRPAGFTDYDRHLWAWHIDGPRQFAEWVLVDQAVWLCGCQASGAKLRVTEHADSAGYGPYVREVARMVGDAFRAMAARHLSRLDSTERNMRAREAVMDEMVTAIETAYAALERAGRPGLGLVDPHPRHIERIEGWRVPVDWAALTAPRPMVAPSAGIRDPHTDFGHVALTGDGLVAVSWAVSANAWDRRSPWEYADWILLDRFMVDQTEPDQYIPYVRGVARVVITAFNAIQPTASASPP